jgi:hypothetical protein
MALVAPIMQEADVTSSVAILVQSVTKQGSAGFWKVESGKIRIDILVSLGWMELDWDIISGPSPWK